MEYEKPQIAYTNIFSHSDLDRNSVLHFLFNVGRNCNTIGRRFVECILVGDIATIDLSCFDCCLFGDYKETANVIKRT